MIIFNTLKFEGFQNQVEFKVFKLDQAGLNVITGKNGIGKSTIFNALAWVLYGKALKEKATVETWEHKRPSTYEGTMVTVSILIGEDKYKVTRCKNYKKQIRGAAGKNRLIFERNGEIFPRTIKDKRDIQRAIIEILGMSYELFINTVIFPQRVTRFIEAGGADKKKILEESFRLAWLNKMADLAKNKRSDTIQLAASQSLKAKSVKDTVDNLEEMLTAIEKSKEEFKEDQEVIEDELNTKIVLLTGIVGTSVQVDTKLKEAITTIETRIDTLSKDKLVTGYDKTERELFPLLTKRDTAKRNWLTANTALTSLNKSNKCIACGQEIPKKDLAKHKRQHREAQAKYNGMFTDYEKQILPLLTDLNNGKKVKESLQKERTALIPLRKSWDAKDAERLKIAGANGRLLELKKRLETEKAKEFKDLSKPIRRKKFEAGILYKKEEAELHRLNGQLKIYHWLVTVPLSNAGIKAFLFDNLLEALNTRVKYYERFTGVGVELEVNMSSARKDIDTIVTKDNYPVSYYDLSGGEGQLINVVMALGQNDILTRDNPSNLYVMDEVFEGLDPENIDIVGNLLSDKAKDCSLFVITHNNAFVPQNANLIRMI